MSIHRQELLEKMKIRSRTVLEEAVAAGRIVLDKARTRKKTALVLLLAAVVVSGLLFETFMPLKTELLQVNKTTIAKTFKEDGLVAAGTERPIHPSSSGKIAELPVVEGQQVQEGDLLAVLDNKELNYSLEQLQAQLKSAQGEKNQALKESYDSRIRQQQLAVDQAQRDFDRINQLYTAGAVSQAEYEQAQDTLKQQQETLNQLYAEKQPTEQYYAGLIESLDAQIAEVEYQIDQCSIKAPFGGVVSELSVKEGSVVDPSAPMMTIVNEESYQVETYVLTEDVPDIHPGMPVDLVQNASGGDIHFGGTVINVAPSAVEKVSTLGLEEHRVKVTVEPEIPDRVTLAPGFELDVEFTTAREDNQLVVPKTALFPSGGGDALWVVRRGRAVIQEVEKGLENDKDVAITSGLNDGDLVILDPQLAGIKEGKRIKGVRLE